MSGYIDLHSHWVAGIDDGATSHAEGIELLRALGKLGFARVVATPHMRPGMFDNTRGDLTAAYESTEAEAARDATLPERGLACEHFFDATVFDRLMSDEGLPYPGGKAVLVEFPSDQLPTRVADRLFDLRRKGLRPVIAHPERYAPVWKSLAAMEDLVDRGMVLLMDVGALAGKYGRAPRKAAERMLDAGLYYAVCSDAHRPSDIAAVAEGMRRLRKLVGDDEAAFLLTDGPLAILAGKVDL